MLTIGSRIDCSVGYYEEALKFLPKTVSRNEDLGCMRRCYVQASCEPSSHRSPIDRPTSTQQPQQQPQPQSHSITRDGKAPRVHLLLLLLATHAKMAGHLLRPACTGVCASAWTESRDRFGHLVCALGPSCRPVLRRSLLGAQWVTAAIMALVTVCEYTILWHCHRSFAPPKMGHCNQHQVPSRTLVWSGPSALSCSPQAM